MQSWAEFSINFRESDLYRKPFSTNNFYQGFKCRLLPFVTRGITITAVCLGSLFDRGINTCVLSLRPGNAKMLFSSLKHLVTVALLAVAHELFSIIVLSCSIWPLSHFGPYLRHNEHSTDSVISIPLQEMSSSELYPLLKRLFKDCFSLLSSTIAH